MSGWYRAKTKGSNASSGGPGGGGNFGAGGGDRNNQGGKGGGGSSDGNTGGGGGRGNRGGSNRGGSRGGGRGRGGGDEPTGDVPMDPDHQPKLLYGHGHANSQDDVYRFATYPPPPNSGKDMVQTNHFLVKSIPEKLFVYNVTFFSASRASESDKEQKGENHEEQEPPESEMREIRKCEKRAIFKSLRSHVPLNDPPIAWATDHEATIWSTDSFPGEEKGVVPVSDVHYRQRNGRLVTLSTVYLTPGDALDFDQGVSPPHANILSGANGQAKTTALNAIVARYVSERPDGVMHVMANKFYKTRAFRQMMYLHAFRGYVDSFSSPYTRSD